jgi:hypothetical protein
MVRNHVDELRLEVNFRPNMDTGEVYYEVNSVGVAQNSVQWRA